MTTVRDLMTRDVHMVSAGSPVVDVARLLLERRINGVPVVDDERNLVGIVTVGDLIHRAADERLPERASVWKEHFWHGVFHRDEPEPDRAEGHTAGQVMTRDVLTVTADTDVIVAARLLLTHNIKALPVVDGRKVVGIIARHDILARLAAHEGTLNPLER